MKNSKWLAIGNGIEHDGDINKVKLAIFRILDNTRAFPMLVKTSELQLNDILFLETSNRSEYCTLWDFHRSPENEIDHWVFTASNIDIPKQSQMMRMTKALLDKEFNSVTKQGETVLLSVRQRT